ncbi:MAG: bacteriophage Gp15 family protein [Sarcina sp.]
MHNILIDILPTEIKVDNEMYEINCDFRTFLLFELLMNDDVFNEEEKIVQSLMLFYPEVPHDISQAIDKLMWFYKCGKEDNFSKNNTFGDKQKVHRIYDFDYDAEYIYSAFLDQYNVDLQEVNLHWWKFKAMFNGLKSDNKIVEIMGYRSIKLNTIKDEEQKKYYKKMKNLYALPVNKNEIDKTNDLEEALKTGDVDKLNTLLKGE